MTYLRSAFIVSACSALAAAPVHAAGSAARPAVENRSAASLLSLKSSVRVGKTLGGRRSGLGDASTVEIIAAAAVGILGFLCALQDLDPCDDDPDSP